MRGVIEVAVLRNFAACLPEIPDREVPQEGGGVAAVYPLRGGDCGAEYDSPPRARVRSAESGRREEACPGLPESGIGCTDSRLGPAE